MCFLSIWEPIHIEVILAAFASAVEYLTGGRRLQTVIGGSRLGRACRKSHMMQDKREQRAEGSETTGSNGETLFDGGPDSDVNGVP